jgi:hypothetical protein
MITLKCIKYEINLIFRIWKWNYISFIAYDRDTGKELKLWVPNNMYWAFTWWKYIVFPQGTNWTDKLVQDCAPLMFWSELNADWLERDSEPPAWDRGRVWDRYPDGVIEYKDYDSIDEAWDFCYNTAYPDDKQRAVTYSWEKCPFN